MRSSYRVSCVTLQALDSVSKGQRKLDLAQRLTGALSSENDRWAENVVQLRADMELLTGDVLLAASFIRYAPVGKFYSMIDTLFRGLVVGREFCRLVAFSSCVFRRWWSSVLPGAQDMTR